jgi:methyl-accepting chemotaxis protein
MRKDITAVFLTACLLSGCELGTRRTVGQEETPVDGQISQLELRGELDRFEYFFSTSMKQTASDLDAAATTQRARRNNMQMRTRILEALYAMTASNDPVVAFFDTWSLVIRLRQYLQEGNGKTLYGDQQPLAVDFIQRSEDEITQIAQVLLKPEQFEKIQANLETFAQQSPITGLYSNLIIYPTREETKEVGPFLRTLSIPMAPIRAMEGVDNTADAIHRVRDSVERFTDVAQLFPETSRWQLSILMDDFEASNMTQSFLISLEQVSQSSARLVEALDTLPQEVKTMLDESDHAQQQLQATMKTAAETAERLERTLAEATETAAAVQNASESIREMALVFKEKTPRGPDDPPPFSMHDFNTMLTNAGQTADKVTAAVVQLQQTIHTDTQTEVQKQLRSVINTLTLRLFGLIVTIFVLAVIYHFIKRKFQ